MFIYFSKI